MEYKRLLLVVCVDVLIVLHNSGPCLTSPVARPHTFSDSAEMEDFVNFMDQYQTSSHMVPTSKADDQITKQMMQNTFSLVQIKSLHIIFHKKFFYIYILPPKLVTFYIKKIKHRLF